MVHMWQEGTDKLDVRIVMLAFTKAFDINRHFFLENLLLYGLP